MAELLTTDTELTTVANAIRGKTGGSDALAYPNGFATAIAGIGADCNAAAGHILSGKTAYVGNSKVTGTMASKGAETYNTSGSDQTIAAGQYLTGAQTIRKVTTSNILAGNIKSGVTIMVGDVANSARLANVTGTFTSDANAAAGDILKNKTAYVNGSKVTGSLESKAAANYYVSESDQTIASGKYLSGAQTIKAVTTQNIEAGNIKKGVTIKVGDSANAGRIKNITGTLAETYTNMPRDGGCYCPFMFNTTDTRNVRFYWDGSGFRASGSDTGPKHFIVPCKIKMAFYPESTSGGNPSEVTFETGIVYTLQRYSDNNDVAVITGGTANNPGYVNTHVYKVYSWSVA